MCDESYSTFKVFSLARPADVHVGADDTYYLVEIAQNTSSQLPADASLEVVGQCGVCMDTPFVMPYDAMLPKLNEANNVLSPVAISASHVR